MKSKVLIVGGFRGGEFNTFGGIIKSCNLLVSSKIKDEFDLILVDSTQISNPPPNLLIRFLIFLRRFSNFIFNLIFKRPNIVLVFSSEGLSGLEKGLMISISYYLGTPSIIFPRAGKLIEQVANSKTMHFLIKTMYSKASVFLCQAETMKEFAITKLNIPTSKVKILNNWTATSELIDLGKERTKNYKNFNNNKLLFVGWLENQKGVLDLIEVFENLQKMGYDLTLTFVGKGNAERILKKIIETKNIKNVNFKGWLKNESLLKAYRDNSIFVFPSWHEGMPNAIIEALSSGLAVISTSVGEIPALVTNGCEALLSPPKDKVLFQKNLEKVLTNYEFKKQISISGHNLAKSKFSTEIVLKKLSKILLQNLKK